MSGTEKAATPRRIRLLLALSGGLVGAGGAWLGQAMRRRRNPGGLTVDQASGRGMPETPPSPQAVRRGFETEDMSASLMATLSIGLGLAIAVSVWLMVVMLHGFRTGRGHEQALTAAQTRQVATPLPHLQAAPLSELATLQTRQRDRLAGYGWADPGHERGRLPIGVAIRRTVGQSLDSAP